jgi:hypothetical protein
MIGLKTILKYIFIQEKYHFIRDQVINENYGCLGLECVVCK